MLVREVGLLGEIVFIICAFSSIMFVAHMVMWALKPSLKFSYSYIKTLFISFTISISVLSYFFVPHIAFDLARHFQYMNEIRDSGKDLMVLVKEAFIGQQYVGHYPTLITFNLLRDVLVFATEENSVLPVITTFVTYAIFSYITLDCLKRYKLGLKWLIVGFIVCFSAMPLLLVVSGVRCAMAFSIVGIAIYLREEKQCSWWLFGILCFIAITTHDSVTVTIILYLMFAILGNKLNKFYILFGTLSIGLFVRLIASSKITFLSALANRFIYYNETFVYQGERLQYYADIILVVVLFFLTTIVSKKGIYKKWIHFFEIYSAFILGTISFGGTVFLTRYTYFLGPLSMIIVKEIIHNAINSNGEDIRARQCLLIITYGVCGISIIQGMIDYLSCLI